MSIHRLFCLLVLAGGMLACALSPASSFAAEETYSIDRDHSFANWTIRHVVSRTSGTFSNVQGKIVLDPDDPAKFKAEATISVFSINSNHRERDAHLLTGDFFDAHQFAAMRFESTGARATGKNSGVVRGRLTLHGVTKEIEFPFEVLGFGPDPWGGLRAGFEARTKIRRSDFGMNWGLDMPGGGPVGDEVDVTLFIEGVRLGPDGTPVKVK